MRQVMFRVHITGKDGVAKRCRLGGDYQLVVKDSSLCLCGVKLNQVIYEWPYPHIRCYGYTVKAFKFVAGRASSSGEGMISVKTEDGFAINEAVNGKVQLMKKNMDLESRREKPTPPADGSGDDQPDYMDPYSVETHSTDEACLVDLSGDEEASRRCQLEGQYNLWVKDSSFCLCDITSNHLLYEWPYAYIRRFGKKRQAFYFEAGRRCSSGEGVFTFLKIFQAAKEKTTWKSPKEHAVLPKTILDGCREVPAYQNLVKEDEEQKAVGADEGDHTYVNLSSLKEQDSAGRPEDKVVGVYSEPDFTGTSLTAIPDKQEYRRAIPNDDISSTSDMEHVYSEPYIT